jgi:hypothetical protein
VGGQDTDDDGTKTLGVRAYSVQEGDRLERIAFDPIADFERLVDQGTDFVDSPSSYMSQLPALP